MLLNSIRGHVINHPVEFCGLEFPNVLGVAAGFDKNVRVAEGLARLGFGHIEVGTLTPRPQPGNPKPRIFRIPKNRAVINRMGFPNDGVDDALPRLEALADTPVDFVLGVSLGKQKETPLEDAAGDYLDVMRKVYRHADYLAVNISSPNTPGLRELQGARYLEELCRALVKESDVLADEHGVRRRPVLVKIAPDVTRAELDEMLGAFDAAGVDGIIATNTTLRRPGIRDKIREEAGGLSGAPVEKRSTLIVSYIHRATNGKLPIIAVGGVSNADDVQRKLDAGASLVQIYTGLIFEGPAMAGEILRELG